MFNIHIIHVAEDPLLSPLEHPPIALIKILINYYILQSVIIFQMWILMNFFLFSSFSAQCSATDGLLKTTTNSTSVSPLQFCGVITSLCCSGGFLLTPVDFHQIGFMLGRASSEASRHSEYSAGCTNFGLRGRSLRCVSTCRQSRRLTQPGNPLAALFSPHRCCKHSVCFCFLFSFPLDEAAESSRDDAALIYSPYGQSQQCSIWTWKYSF